MSHDLDQRIEGITKGNISKSQWWEYVFSPFCTKRKAITQHWSYKISLTVQVKGANFRFQNKGWHWDFLIYTGNFH